MSTAPARLNDSGINASLSLTALTAVLEEQQKTIKTAKTTLGAAFGVIKFNKPITTLTQALATDLQLTVPASEKPVTTLNRLINAADDKSLDTTGIKKLMPAIEAIAEKVEAAKAGPYKTIKIARQQLKQ
ncbi:MAG: hypothetical protein PW788_11580 [Micavibrio sp.]|nr:hypothetical protein [Micavibrio sp.]